MTPITLELFSNWHQKQSNTFQPPHDDKFSENHQHNYDKPYIFLRDVDIEPLILDGEHHFFTQA